MTDAIRWPLTENVIRGNRDSNTFGMVRRRADGSKKPHQGWDFAAPIGTPCYAIGDGKVAVVRSGGDFGLIVVHSFLFEDRIYYAAYAHLSSAQVEAGDAVRKGELIARTGKSGNASNLPAGEMHLHFEIRLTPTPGLGLAGRVSPLKVFGVCPLRAAINDPI